MKKEIESIKKRLDSLKAQNFTEAMELNTGLIEIKQKIEGIKNL